jgi:hypothetical protein
LLDSFEEEPSVRARKMAMIRMIGLGAAGLLGIPGLCMAQAARDSALINTADLDKEIRQFLAREIAAHVADIKSLDPPPDRVVGALTTGEFSWGTFMRTLAAYSDLDRTRTVAGRDVIPMIAKIGPIELRQGGKTWAQLYAALALQHFGTDLHHNALWQSLSPDEKVAWKSLLDPGRFYDLKTHRLIHLPENYFGVAARIAAIDFRIGLTTDRAYVDDLLDRAAQQFTGGALFADDALPTGRYDRYSNEYARAIYDAAVTAGRADIMKAVAPSLKEQMRLWWDLLAPDGYGYSWGRSLGAISYMDTLEISAFLASYPEFRPAPLVQLASAYYAAWRWLRSDFNDQTHLLSVFAFGRGDYSYITKEREWQQTTAFLGKLINAHVALIAILAREGVAGFPPRLALPDIARFEFFKREAGRQFGVWLIRRDGMRFALPFVTGPRAATSDYLPAPHGLPGFAVPVEQIYPCFIPYVELEDGRIIAAADGADEIRPAPDGSSVTATWDRWVVPGSKAGETVDLGITSTVTWSVREGTLARDEIITAAKRVGVKRLWMAIPSRADQLSTTFSDGGRSDRLASAEGTIEIRVAASNLPISISALATGDTILGRGARGAIPLQLELRSGQTILDRDHPLRWRIEVATQKGDR